MKENLSWTDLMGVLFSICIVIVLLHFLSVTYLRNESLKNRLLICEVLDEMGADTADPRIVDACPVP